MTRASACALSLQKYEACKFFARSLWLRRHALAGPSPFLDPESTWAL